MDPRSATCCTEPPPETKGQQSWERTLWAAWVAQLISITAFALVMPFMPFYIRDLGVKGEAAVSMWSGITITASGLMLALFSPVWGTLADRYGRKLMVERAMFGGAIILLIMGSVRNVYQLVLLRGLQGVFTGTMTASNTLVSSVVPRDKMAFSLGLMYTAVLTGNCVGPWVGGVIADHWGYRTPFYFSSALLLIGGLVVLWMVRENFVPLPPGAPRRTGLRKTFGFKGLAALLGVFFFMSFSTSFVGPIFPLFVEKLAVGLPPATISGMLMGITGVAAGISAIIVGRISDRIGHRRLLVASTLASGILSIPQAAVTHLWQLFGLRVLGGFATGGTSPTMNAIVGSSVPPEITGRAYGFCASANSFGFALGPLAGATLSAHMGLRWPFAVMGVLLILCAGFVQVFLRPKPYVPAGMPGSTTTDASTGLSGGD
jgi:DHA1 family multidrug resistance protein-like MFS transporter